VNNLWVWWKRDDQEKYQRQPPGGHASGYAETAANFLTNERILADLEIEERFDAGIDRALKRLFSLKAAEQLDRPRIVESKPPPRLQQTPRTNSSKGS
jgi:hypothetical protein